MTNPQPGWYPESPGSTTLRWWDGTQWTNHTQAAQQQPSSDASGWEIPLGGGQPNPDKIRDQQRRAGVGQVGQGGGTLFSEPVLVVNQKVKLIEMANEYSVFDQHGRQIGSVAEVGQSALKKAVRFLSSYDQFMTHRLEVRDVNHQTVLRLTRPAKLVKSRMIVERGDGAQLGEIVQQNVFGKIRFSFVVGGQDIGGIQAENWRAWNFAVVDHTGAEVARITKTFEGIAKTLFTTADNYVLQIHRQLPDPLLSMVVASALTVDTALKQDNRGWN
ncbi:phospholipid scramblase-related protein [Actinokineospora inagensis]|uniref:phospholipid scramblase-related protein n=1 Tax=Actinokineospora inagensis TaxID=103730 RepID=UPI0003F5E374|nr:phospholipid scramblase-related protein [Actinokineospora inagensis]